MAVIDNIYKVEVQYSFLYFAQRKKISNINDALVTDLAPWALPILYSILKNLGKVYYVGLTRLSNFRYFHFRPKLQLTSRSMRSAICYKYIYVILL